MSDPYDELHYETSAEPRTHPDRLGASAWLGGLEPAEPTSCRVLELGSGDGANIVPMAAYLPGSTFVAVERATVPHARAVAERDALGLDNLECLNEDLGALDPDALGSFDYVIAHGLLSWIDEPSREALFRLAGRVLAPQGVFAVSYNVKPAWGIRGALRDAMRLAVEPEPDLAHRVEAARGVIRTLREELGRPEDPYQVVLARDLEFLAEQPGYFILHGLLAEENRPFSVSEVIARAERHGLRFASEQLGVGVDDLDGRARRRRLPGPPALVEQLCDVLERRALRMTAFVRADARGPARTHRAWLAQGRLSGRLTEHPDGRFESFNRVRITPRSEAVGEALRRIADSFPVGVALAELPVERDRDLADLARLLEAGHLEVRRGPPRCATTLADRPLAHPYVRHDAARRGALTTPYHEVVPLDDLTRQIAIACDGTRDEPALASLAAEALERADEELRDPVRRRLEALLREGLLADGRA